MERNVILWSYIFEHAYTKHISRHQRSYIYTLPCCVTRLTFNQHSIPFHSNYKTLYNRNSQTGKMSTWFCFSSSSLPRYMAVAAAAAAAAAFSSIPWIVALGTISQLLTLTLWGAAIQGASESVGDSAHHNFLLSQSNELTTSPGIGSGKCAYSVLFLHPHPHPLLRHNYLSRPH